MPIPFEAFAGSGGLIPSLNELVAAFVNKRTSQAKERRDDRKSELAQRLADKQNELYAARTKAEAEAREKQREQDAAQNAANYELAKNTQAFKEASDTRKSELDWQRADAEGIAASIEASKAKLEMLKKEPESPEFQKELQRYDSLIQQQAVFNGMAIPSNPSATGVADFSNLTAENAESELARMIGDTSLPKAERVKAGAALVGFRNGQGLPMKEQPTVVPIPSPPTPPKTPQEVGAAAVANLFADSWNPKPVEPPAPTSQITTASLPAALQTLLERDKQRMPQFDGASNTFGDGYAYPSGF